MRETSDTMQNLALAYGERQCLDYCIEQLKGIKSNANKAVLTKIFRLFGIEIMRRDLSFYMINGAINTAAARSLETSRTSLIKSLAEQALDILDCLNIPKHALYTPIAGNYERYNSVPNFGEVVEAKM